MPCSISHDRTGCLWYSGPFETMPCIAHPNPDALIAPATRRFGKMLRMVSLLFMWRFRRGRWDKINIFATPKAAPAIKPTDLIPEAIPL